MKFEYAPNATPIDGDEIAGLIPKHITTQGQLNEWENANILKAEGWLAGKRQFKRDIFTIDFIKLLHKKMFAETWKWAGAFRKSAKNIGVDQAMITTELQKLLDDACYQIEYKSYQMDEIAYRFHHRLVFIHPFPNGNGRHARLMTDILLLYVGQPRFSWGSKQLEALGPVRKQYIDALKKADKHDYSALAGFVRS